MVAKQYYQNASEVRKNWSMTIDSVIHVRPAFINRTHDRFVMLDEGLLSGILSSFKYHVTIEEEDDGSLTGYVEELQLVENASTRNELLSEIVFAMKDYAMDYYNDFSYWSKAPNRADHIPYVIKILTSDEKTILEELVCQDGGN